MYKTHPSNFLTNQSIKFQINQILLRIPETDILVWGQIATVGWVVADPPL